MASWFNDIISAGKTGLETAAGKISKTALDLATISNPSLARIANAKLKKNGQRSSPNPVDKTSVNYSSSISKHLVDDWRIRISTSDKVQLYGANTGITSPLSRTNGVVFPYTPQITVVHQANYSPQKFTHSNYAMFTYENSEVQAIQITADFTVQTQDEAKYLLACIYFFRAATKMYFGKSPNSGNPPPLVYLDGYGSHYFPHVPCLITQFSHTMPNDVDYIETNVEYSQSASRSEINSKGVPVVFKPGDPIVGNFRTSPENSADRYVSYHESTRIPTASQLTLNLQPVYSKKVIGDKFNLHEFARGNLIKGNGGFL